MGSYAATFAMVGGTFAIVDCLAETVRGEFLLLLCLACTRPRGLQCVEEAPLCSIKHAELYTL